MDVPGKKHLLGELDPLSYRTRSRLIAALGHAARRSPALDALLDELAAGDTWEQGLALQAAIAARRPERVMAALRSGSAWLQSQAAGAAGRMGDAATLEATLAELAPAARRRLVAGVVKGRRTAVAERLLPLLLERYGPRAAAPLLKASSPATVRRALPDLAHAIPRWQGLSAVHPDAVLDYLGRRLAESSPSEAGSVLRHFRTALPVLAVARPARLLELVLAMPSEVALLKPLALCLGALARREPAGVRRLLARPACRRELAERGLPPQLRRHLRRLPDEAHLELARTVRESPEALADLLAALAPSRRAAVFRHAVRGLEVAERDWPPSLLAVLPPAERDAEVRRMLALRHNREDPDRTLELVAWYDVAQARAPLEAAASSRAARRGRALALLVASTGRSRHGLEATLAFLCRIRNEQDPVRHHALDALAELPPGLWRPEHVAVLSQLVDFALTARDTSWLTRSALRSLACRLLTAQRDEPEGALFQLGLEIFRRLAGEVDDLALPFRFPDVPRGTEHRLFAAVEPGLRAADEEERHALVTDLAASLGKRAWTIPALQELLAGATEARSDRTAKKAIALWLADPRSRDQRARVLVDRDPSAICVEAVFRHLHQRRQEWLDPFLERRSLKGRFVTRKTVYLLPARGGFHRWLPRQQQAFRQLLCRVAADRTRSHRERTGAIKVLARLPIATAEDLRSFLDDEEVTIVEAALGALAWTDHPHSALPILLAHLDGDRARVAMYAASRCARRIAPRRLEEVVAQLLAREKLKVTVHKEAVRLLGRNRSPGAAELLWRVWSRPDLHRDVRIACGHAARRLLDRPRAWEILTALAAADDADLARTLLTATPDRIATAWRPLYAELILRLAEHADPRLRHDAFAELSAWTAGAEQPIAAAASRSLADLEAGGEWRRALEALIAACRDGQAAEVLVPLAHALRTAPVPEAHDAGREHDLPARRRLLRLSCALSSLPAANRARLRPWLLDLADELRQDATLWPAAAGLTVAALDWGSAEETAAALLRLVAEASVEPLFMRRLAAEVEATLGRDRTLWEPAAAVSLLDRLDRVQDVAARLVEISIVKAAAQRVGWVEPWAGRLRKLRRHENVGVRMTALEVRTGHEVGKEDGFAGCGLRFPHRGWRRLIW